MSLTSESAGLPGWAIAPELTQSELAGRVIETDRRLVQLLDWRLEAALAADLQKDILGREVLAPQREMAVLYNAYAENQSQGKILDNADITQFYTRIMRNTRTQQLIARKVRGTITRDEQKILNQVTGSNDPIDHLPTTSVKQVEDWEDLEAAESLTKNRQRIDALDVAIIYRLAQRQRDIFALDEPVLAGQVQTAVREENIRLGSRLSGVDLAELFEVITVCMRRRQVDAAEARRLHGPATIGNIATNSFDDPL